MVEFDDTQLDILTSIFGQEQIDDFFAGDLCKYQQDPVGFFKNVLGIKIIPDDLIEIAESVRDNKRTVCKSATGVGKTFIAAAISIWWYKCFPESQVIITAAPPEDNIRTKLFGEINNMILSNKKLFKKDKILSLRITDDIDFKGEDSGGSSKHFIMGKPISLAGTVEERESKWSGSHAPFLLIISDEGDAIGDEVYRGQDGCLSSDGARQLIMYNPKRMEGEAYRLSKSKRAKTIILSAFNHPNVTSGKDLIPGAVSRDKVVERIHEWSAPLREGEEKDSNCFDVPEYLVGVVARTGGDESYPPLESGTRRITNSAFSYKILGVYPKTTENSLFNKADIDSAISRWKLYNAQYGEESKKGMGCVLGCDIADMGADDCCVAKKYGNYVEGFLNWKGLDVDLSADKIANIYASLDAYQANIESDGIGAAIPPKLGRMFYWKCENETCVSVGSTYLDEKIFECPVCHKNLTRKHFNARKIYVSSPSEKKCDIGRFALLRDELAWTVAEWLKKEPSAMIPDDEELVQQMMAYEYYEDPSSGKIKVSDKKTVRKKLDTNSDDKFAALRMCFFEPKVPKIRIV